MRRGRTSSVTSSRGLMNCAPISSSISTRTALKALGQRVCVETAARFDTVHSTQAWPSDVMSGGSQRNASEEKSDREDPAVWGVGSA